MAAASRLGKQLEEVISTLGTVGARFALIGGLALVPHKVIRATQDIDLLTDAANAETIHQALIGLGYQCLHRSPDAANYMRGDERVDFIFAYRPAAIRMLSGAPVLQTPFGDLRVVTTEGLMPPIRTESTRDPFETLDDLMTVVEALCPRWPVRGTFSDSDTFLI